MARSRGRLAERRFGKGSAVALDIFLKLGDIKGDSVDARHRDAIVVLSWDWGIAQTAAPVGGGGAGGGAAVGRTDFRRLRFAHRIDVASPLIMLACASGRRLREATLTVRKPGASAFEFLIVKLSDVSVTSVESAVNEEEGELYELVALDFMKVDLQYIPQSAAGGPGTPVRFGWDIRTNTPLP